MTRATDISICIIMGAALIVLTLEAIGNKQIRMKFSDRPHIHLLTIGILIVSFLLIFLDLLQNNQLTHRPTLFIHDIASIFLIINTAIFLLMSRNDSTKQQNGELYFFILASLALAMSNINSTSLVLKMITSIGWLVVMTTLAILSIPEGKKAEIGIKMGFSTIVIALQFIFALFLLNSSHHHSNLELLTLNSVMTNSYAFIGVMLIALTGLSLTGTPPFHFGYIDCADGGNVSVAFLFLSNSIIQGCSILLAIKTVLMRSGFNIDSESNLLGSMLIFGFMVLCIRSLDQSKIRRTIAYIAICVGPLLSMSILFGSSVLLPKWIFILAIYSFATLSLFTLYGSLIHMDPISLSWQTWEDISGFGRLKPLPTLTFLIALASIAGLPGTLGYFVKLSLIAPLQENIIFSGSIFLSIAFGAACVMRIFVFMFSKESSIDRTLTTKTRLPIVLLMASLILIAFGFFPFVR
jgi:NADH-quinone oxidoreductase subunit N